MFRPADGATLDPIELYIIDGDYGLPSLDVDCVKSILYARGVDVPVEVILRNGIVTCSLYSAPSMVDKDFLYVGYKEIAKHLRKYNIRIDTILTSRQASTLCAWQSLIETDLVPVLSYMQWVDPRNCEELTVPWHMKALPFPFNYWYIKKKKARAAELIQVLYPGESDEAIRECLRRSATIALSTLSTRLGSAQYYNGEEITSLDVLVYASISPFIKIPYPSTELTSLIFMWTNLLDFVKRVDLHYFPDVGPGPKYLLQKDKVQQNDDEMSYITMFFLLTGASAMMLCFAVNKGIIKFE